MYTKSLEKYYLINKDSIFSRNVYGILDVFDTILPDFLYIKIRLMAKASLNVTRKLVSDFTTAILEPCAISN